MTLRAATAGPLVRILSAAAILLCLAPNPLLAMPFPGEGTAADTESISNTGQNQLSIPIPVPPATGGFGPSLTLRYSSEGGDGPFGVGWSLELGEIRRSLRFAVPAFDDVRDAFELSGELLVPNPSESRTGRVRYHTLTESFARILHIQSGADDFWEVTRPDGTVLRFGSDRGSRVLRDGDAGPIDRWLLREMEDAHGNIIRFTHLIENGADYPLRVEFSFRGGSPVGRLRQVEIGYELRPDPSFTFTGGVARAIQRRASEIIVRSGSEIFRRIELTYADEAPGGKSYSTGRSRLSQLQVFGVGGEESLPAQHFEYRDSGDENLPSRPASAFERARFSLPPGVRFDAGSFVDVNTDGRTIETSPIRFGDVNGDGRVDLVRALEEESGRLVQEVYLGTGAQFELSPGWSAALALDPAALARSGRALRAAVTENPDCFIPAAELVAVPNPVLFASAARTREFSERVSEDPVILQVTPPATWELADVNGDGRADLLSSYVVADFVGCDGEVATSGGRSQEVWINTGAGWERDASRSAGVPEFALAGLESNTGSSVLRFRVSSVELNGDGLADLAIERSENGLFEFPALRRYQYFRQQPGAGWSLDAGYASTPAPTREAPADTQFADLNNDGLTDVVAGDALAVGLNTGGQFCSAQPDEPAALCPAAERFQLPTDPSGPISFVDLNGDGLVDLAERNTDPSRPGRAWIHDPGAPGGTVFVEAPAFAPPPGDGRRELTGFLPPQPVLLDVDADGAVDVLARTANQSFRGRVRFSDRLSQLENGQGAEILYAYESAVQQEGPAQQALADRFAQETEGLLRTSSAPVLAGRVVRGTALEPFSERFAYARSRFEPALRMTLGFALVQSTVEGAVTRNRFFAQQVPLRGQLLRSETLDPRTGALVAQEERRFEVLAGDDRAVGDGSTSGARVARLVERTSAAVYDGPGSERPGAVLREQFEYGPQRGARTHGFGFVTRTVQERPSGTLVTTRTLRAPDLERWIVGLAEEVSQSDGRREVSRATLRYSETGDPTQVTEIEGRRGELDRGIPRTTVRSFDAFGNLRTETDPGQRTTELCYDGDERFPSGASCASPTVEATHSSAVSVRDPLGQVTTKRPDPVTGLTLETRRLYSGEAERQRFDPFGRVTETHFAPVSGPEILLSELRYFDASNSPVGEPFVETWTRTRPGSDEQIRSATYLDGFGRTVRSVSEAPRAAGGARRFFGTATHLRTAQRETTQTLAAACGQRGADPHCAGLLGQRQPRTTQQRDALGRPTLVATPDGITQFAYRSVERVHPDSGPGRFDAVLALDARGALTQRILDQDRVLWVEECSNAPVRPRGGELERMECIAPAVSFYRYEATGELTEIHAPSGAPPGIGEPALRFVVDSLGREIETHDQNKDRPTRTVYDAAGNIDLRQNARGQRVDFDRDPLGRPTLVTVPLEAGGMRTYSVRYDLRTREPERIEQRETAPGSQLLSVQEFGYDALGRRSRETLRVGSAPALTTAMTLDLLGRPTRVETPDQTTVLAYEYEGAYLARVCELGSAGNCAQRSAFAYLSDIEFDEIGRERGLVGPVPESGPAPELTLEYNPQTFRLEHLELIPSAGRAAERLDLRYRFDPVGNVLEVVDQSPRSGGDDVSLSVSYTYDARNRLLSRTRGRETRHFTIDALGNLTGNAVDAPGGTNQIYDREHPNRVLEAQGLTYGYDADGNTTRRGAQGLRYDALGRMECIGAAGRCEQRFLYGLDGLRLASFGSGGPARVFAGDLFEFEPGSGAATVRVLALGRQIAFKRIDRARLRGTASAAWAPLEPIIPVAIGLIALLAASALAAALRRAGFTCGIRLRPAHAAVAVPLALLIAVPPSAWAAPLPTNQGTYRRLVFEDRLGSGVHITDEEGRSVAERAFEPFGGLAAQRSSEPTEQTFAGQRFDDGLGLYDFRARWYDPASGRFLSVDPLVRSPFEPQSLNAYSYVENDPVNLVDPSGMQGEPIDEIVVIGNPIDPFGPGGPFFDPGVPGNLGSPDLDLFLANLGPDAAGGGDAVFSATAGRGPSGGVQRGPVEAGRAASSSSGSSLVRDGLIVGGLLILTVGAILSPFDGPVGDAFAAAALASRAGPFLTRLALFVTGTGGAVAAGAAATRGGLPAFTQTTASAIFRNGPFRGRTIGQVAQGLRAGLIKASELTVDVVRRDGNLLALNSRFFLALLRGGVRPDQITFRDVTGNPLFERILTERLIRNGLTSPHYSRRSADRPRGRVSLSSARATEHLFGRGPGRLTRVA